MKKISFFLLAFSAFFAQAAASLSLIIDNQKENPITVSLKDSSQSITVPGKSAETLKLSQQGLYNFTVDEEGHIFNIAFDIDKDKSKLLVSGPKGSISACVHSPRD